MLQLLPDGMGVLDVSSQTKDSPVVPVLRLAGQGLDSVDAVTHARNASLQLCLTVLELFKVACVAILVHVGKRNEAHVLSETAHHRKFEEGLGEELDLVTELSADESEDV